MAKKSTFISILLILFLFMTSVIANATEQTVFGPEDFEIGAWHLHLSRHSFSATNPGYGYIAITKNTPELDINAGFLFFNRKFIPLGQFYRSDDVIIYKDVTLNASNKITVFLAGSPGASVNIKINKEDSPLPPPEINFSANPMSIFLGESSTLSWSVTNADIVTIDNDIGYVSTDDSIIVTPQETTTYTIVAIGPGGNSTETATVTVSLAPPTVEIFATPETIILGESANLSWTSTYADTCVIEPDIGEVDLNGAIDITPSESTTYTIVANGPGGTATDEITVTVINPSPTVTFSVDPETINLGESTTLTWSTEFTDTCVIEPDIGTVELNGSILVSPTESTTYILTATGTGGTVSQDVLITVINIPTVNLTANPETILMGGLSTLTWTSENADSCSIEPDIGNVDPNGSRLVGPYTTTTYTITAFGPGGTAEDSATVMVSGPPTISISADPTEIMLGESSTLTWDSTDADACMIEPDIGSVACDGSIVVSPAATTTYTISATGPYGSAMSNVTVIVSQPPTATLSANPDTIFQGESTLITWTTTHASNIEIDQGIGPVAASGSMSVAPTETTTYTLTASGPGGTATDSATVTIGIPAEPTVTISADPVTIEVGQPSLLTWASLYAYNAHIDNGVGAVPVDGSVTVYPENTTTYTITVSGLLGSSSASVKIIVNGDPEPQEEGTFGNQYNELVPEDATIEAYDDRRFAIITGLVEDMSGLPLEDVQVTILGHPEYGTATTNVQGEFSMPVEGGSVITVVYRKSDFITAHRKVDTPWNDIAIAETIQMISQDPVATTITFDGNPDTILTHKSTPTSDEFGDRSATLVFNGDNQAWLLDEQGNDVHELTTITTRATEFATPESMPAKLPPNSAYTYCNELSVDGAQRVRFEKPVVMWVENFLGFDAGMVVPVGYYDRDRGVWVPADNGVVVRLLDTDTDGIVDALDADNDGQPDDLDSDGVFFDEVEGLNDPVTYPPDATFWRVAVSHFTPWDCNWPYGPPADAIPPNPIGIGDADQQLDEEEDCQNKTGSFVEERSRVFHEDISIPGTDMSLHYTSSRVKGNYSTILVPASGETIPASLKKIIVKVSLAGRLFKQELDPLPNQKVDFSWDGLDYLGKPVSGTINAFISIGFAYDAVYTEPGEFDQAFAQAGDTFTGIRARREIISWQHNEIEVDSGAVFSGKGIIANGWTLSSHHRVNPLNVSTLYKGDGTISKSNVQTIEVFAGTGVRGYSGDGGPAVEAEVDSPTSIAVDKIGNVYFTDNVVRKVDINGIITTEIEEGVLNTPTDVAIDGAGNLYIVENQGHRVSKMDTSGIITTVAGTGIGGYSGDGGLATEAQLYFPGSVQVDNFGNLFIVDSRNFRIRKVDPNGIITTIAGNGIAGFSGDGGPATEASINSPNGLTIDNFGNLFFASEGINRVRKIDSSGVITTVAGIGWNYYSGDGGPATEAGIRNPRDIVLDRAGNMFIMATTSYRIRVVDTNGIITTVAGSGVKGYPVIGVPPTETMFRTLGGIGLDEDGHLIIADASAPRILKVEKPTAFDPLVAAGDIPFAEENGLGHVMSRTGLHQSTIDLDTRVKIREFGYDENDNLITITDQFGNQTTIQRDVDGVPVSITSPDGIVTGITIDAYNNLTRITHPDDSFYEFEYTEDGLLTAKIEPEGNRFEHQYDAQGRLTDATEDEGGHWTFTKTALENGDILTEVLTGEGNLTTYLDHTDSTGAYTSTITDPTGTETLISENSAGLVLDKSLPCGMNLRFEYDLDPEYKYKFVKELRETTPSLLERVTNREKDYQDTDIDETPDLITETVSINGKTTSLVHDTLQSEKITTSPVGRAVSTLYDATTLLPSSISIPGLLDTNFGYDTKGRLTSLTTGTRETAFTYNTQGFLDTVTDPEDHVFTYVYDEVGRVTRVDRPDTASIWFDYDLNGNMTVLTVPSLIDHGFGYNAVNRKDAYNTPLSGSYIYTYDKDRRLTGIAFPSGLQHTYIYGSGRLDQIQTPEGNIDYTYLCGSKIDTISKSGETITYGYDGSLVTSESLSGALNQNLVYTYNSDFYISDFTYAGDSESYVYDNDGLLTGAGSFTITRNADNGLPDDVVDGNFNLSRSFNGHGEIASEDTVINSIAVNSWNVIRDNIGRITQKTETVDGITSSFSYTYDSMGRLLTVTKDSNLVEAYQYNANGTRTYEMNMQRGIAGRNLTYSDEDHLLTTDTATYQYNLDGFLVSKTESTDVTNYNYSSSGELLSITLPDSSLIEYSYDPLGRRIAKKVDGTTTEKYLWQGMTRLLAVYDGNDNLLMRFEYADGRTPLAMMKGGVRYYFTYNQVGTLRVVADSSGNVVKHMSYDSFGNIIIDSDPLFEVPFGFAGGLQDKDTGLVRFGYRDYDPDIGRWTAKDPTFFAGGDTDLFGYVQNDPVNWIDPYGLVNPVKMGVGFVNAVRGITGMASGVATLVTGTVAMPFTGGLSGTLAYPIGAAQLTSGFANLNRGLGQMSEAHDESPCQSSFKNLLGLLPFGQKYDDALEPGFKEYFADVWDNYVEDPWDATKQTMRDFFAFD